MKHTYFDTGTVKATVVRDAHCPEEIYIETKVNDKRQLHINDRIRKEELLPSGTASKLVDGDVISYAFSFPTVQNYEMVKDAQPDLMQQVQYGEDSERLAAALKLAVLYPQYVISHHKKRIR